MVLVVKSQDRQTESPQRKQEDTLKRMKNMAESEGIKEIVKLTAI